MLHTHGCWNLSNQILEHMSLDEPIFKAHTPYVFGLAVAHHNRELAWRALSCFGNASASSDIGSRRRHADPKARLLSEIPEEFILFFHRPFLLGLSKMQEAILRYESHAWDRKAFDVSRLCRSYADNH
jgi:hypothetical protein